MKKQNQTSSAFKTMTASRFLNRMALIVSFIAIIGTAKTTAQTTIVGWSSSYGFEFTDNSTYWWNPKANLGTPANSGISLMKTFGGVSHASSSTWFDDLNAVIYNNNSEGSSSWAGGTGTKGWIFSFTTLGYNTLKFEGKMAGTYSPSINWYGPRDFKLQYSLNNSTWTDVSGGAIAAAMDNKTASFNSASISNVALPAACDNQSVVYLRMVMTSETSVDGTHTANAGNSIIDDFIVTGTAQPAAPTVTTSAVTSINATTAIGNGNLTSLGSPAPTAYGICWNTTGAPTVSNAKSDKGTATATGAFSANMTGLTANTTYYVRAFATNASGTVYGSAVSFTTSSTSWEVEYFEDETASSTAFTNNGYAFSITGSKLAVTTNVGWGWSGTTADNFYVDNANNLLNAPGVIGSFKNTTATFKVSDLYIFPSSDANSPTNDGTVIIRGKLNGSTLFTQTISSTINTNFSTMNGFTYVDFGANNTISINELEFELTGSLKYLSIDALKHHSTVVATGIATTNATSIKIYPNPVADIVNISTGNNVDNGSYTIRTISGAIVEHGTIANGEATANIQKLNSGTYILQIQVCNTNSNHSIIKK